MSRFSSNLLVTIFTITLGLSSVSAQKNKPKNYAFKGYLKNMSTFSWTPYLADTLWYDNLTHNRINFSYYPSEAFSVYIEMRNRLFTGASVKNIPNYGEIIDANNDYFDLSVNVIDNENTVLNLMFDRLYVQWVKKNWDIQLGRQRINWGINLAWNPNDWFNAYSFFDFDYEERPGSDALRVTYYTGVASSIVAAVKLADSYDDFVAAGLYKTNKGSYDLQFLGGLAQGDVAVGTGWAGNLKKASFKGELSGFFPVIATESNSVFLKTVAGKYIKDANGNRIVKDERYDAMFLGSISIDYSFKNSLYLNGSIMYSSVGNYDANLLESNLNQQLGTFTVRDLSPYPWSTFVQSTFQATPLIYVGGSVMYYPGTNNFFINPLITYSLVQNIDLDIVGQIFFGDDQNGAYTAISKSLFGRIKWSF